MRSLKYLLQVYFFCFCFINAVHAEAPDFNFSSSYFSSKGQTIVTSTPQANNLSLKSFGVSASSGLIENAYRLRFSTLQIKRDVSNYFFIDRFGETTSLNTLYDGKESIFGGGGDFIYKKWTFSLDGQNTVSDSPIGAKSLTSKAQYGNYDSGTNASLEFQTQDFKRPPSFFRTVETNQLGSLPEKNKRYELKLVLDQLLSEQQKVTAFLKGGRSPDENRKNFGGGLKTYWSLTDSISLFGALEHQKDIKGSLPKDNRGFFNLTSYEAGLGYEITYDLIIKLIAGTTVEYESARGINSRQLVGTDSYALAFTFKKSRYALKLMSKIEESNTGYKSFQMNGGFLWEI